MLSIILLGIFIYFSYYEKKAIYYTIYNDLFCGKEECDLILRDLKYDSKIDVSNYSINLARYVADLINRVYQKADTKDLLKIKDLYIKENSDPFGMIWKDKNNNMYVIFRGSENFKEWLQDLNLSQNNFSKKTKNVNHQVKFQSMLFSGSPALPNVHKGFYDVYSQVIDDIDSLINNNKPTTIVFGGHSLGAVVSVLCSVNYPNSVVYNFGCPKIGDDNFVNMINSLIKVFRHCNGSDVVATMPSSVSANYNSYNNPYFYIHCGILKYFDLNRKSLDNNHSMNTYIFSLENSTIV